MAIANGDGSIILSTKVDTSGLNKGMSQMQGKATSLTKTFSKLGKTIASAFAIQKIIQFSNASANMATQAEASVQRLVDIYGSASDSVGDFIDANARALGMSKAAAASFSSVYGNLFSVWADQATNAELTNRYLNMTAVVASKTGRTVEDVQERIRSGLLGNTEAIEDLGVFVNVKTIEMTDAFQRMADGKSWEQLDAYTQQQIRSMAILEQATAKYGNEVANTSATIRNRFNAAYQDFRNSWGNIVNTVLIPVLKTLTQVFNIATKTLNALSGRSNRVLNNAQLQEGSAAKTAENIKEQTKNQKELNEELKKSTASFDDVEILSSQTASNIGNADIEDATNLGVVNVDTTAYVEDEGLDKFSRKIKKVFGVIAEDIIPAIVNGFKWIKNNWKNIRAALLGVFSAIVSAKIVMGIAKAITAFKTLFTMINLFVATNPIGLIAVSVGLLVGGVVALSAAADEYTEAQRKEMEAAKESAEIMKDKAEAYLETKRAIEEQTDADLAEIGRIEALNEELKLLVDEKGRVAEKDEARVQFILNELNTALGTEYSMTDGLIKNYQSLQKEIDTLIQKKQAEIWLNDALAKYEEAVLNQQSAREDVSQTRIELDNQKNALAEKQNELLEKQAELEEYLASVDPQYQDTGYVYALKEQISELEHKIIPYEEELLSLRQEAYDEATKIMLGYLGDIERYEKGQTLVLEGETSKAIEYLSQTSEAVKEQQKAYEDGVKGQAQALQDSKDEAEAWAKFVKEQYEKGVAGVSKEAVDEAEEAAKEAKTQWEEVGKALIEGTASGVENSAVILVNTAVAAVKKALEAAKEEMGGDFNGYIPPYPSPNTNYGVQIPGLAQGAVIPPNREFLAVLGDNKRENEIVSPVSTMKQAFMEAMIEMGGNFGGGNAEIILEIDGREFGRAVVEQGNRENRRIGTRLAVV